MEASSTKNGDGLIARRRLPFRREAEPSSFLDEYSDELDDHRSLEGPR
jgi:hypothetical protein